MLNYIKYEKDSNRKYILLIHCFCANMHIFDKQLEYFKKEYNVILIDLPFHGGSKYYEKKLNYEIITNEIIGILDENNISKVTVIGLSLGSTIANYLCYYHSNRVEKAIFASSINGLKNSFLNFCFRLFNIFSLLLPLKLYVKILMHYITSKSENQNYRNAFYNRALSFGKSNMNKWLRALSKHFRNYKKYLSQFCNNSKIPKLYIIGEQDSTFLPAIKKNVIINKYNKIKIVKNKSHMLDILENNSFYIFCKAFIDTKTK